MKEPVCEYRYDLGKLHKHVSSLTELLPANVSLYYAVKANSDSRVLQTLSPLVDGFEIASVGELRKVSSFVDKGIMFSGPGKKDREVRQLIQTNDCLLTLESFLDIERTAYIAGEISACVPVLLRVNLLQNVSESQLKMAGVPTQFGISEAEIPLAIAAVISSPSLDLVGFHFHSMSNNLDATAHGKFIRHCVEVSEKWEQDFSLRVRVINFGGGIGINYWNENNPFDFTSFLPFLHEVTRKRNDVRFVLELGRYLVAEMGTYAVEVLDVKENHGEVFVVVRGGTHHLRLPAAWKMSQPFTVVPVEEWEYPFARPVVQNKRVTIVGELCTPNDVLARSTRIDCIRVGDVIEFSYAGAYGWEISHHGFLSHAAPTFMYKEKE